jgi:REP element-mobilizing transposase RayT
MPRKARIDAPGAVHHVIVRGIEQRSIFKDDRDRDGFIGRMGGLLQETETPCYAWALMDNHAHLLLRTGTVGISTVMRRLLTGHAISFNKRHRRFGHLFQNRFKSILCEESRYLKQLIAYIHLNPFRSGTVPNIAALKTYPFTGFSALMGAIPRPWQDTQYALSLFGKNTADARRNLHAYVSKWSQKGHNSDLTGGGLIRSSGGWVAVREAYRSGVRLASDERILGSSEFVQSTLKRAGEVYDRSVRLQAAGVDLSVLARAVCTHFKTDEKSLAGATRQPEIARSRAVISYVATRELAIPGSKVAQYFKVDRSAVCRAAQRIRNDKKLVGEANKIIELLMVQYGQH